MHFMHLGIGTASSVVADKNVHDAELKVSPNPVVGSALVNYELQRTGNTVLKITDMNCR